MSTDIFTLYQYTQRESGKRYIGVTGNPQRRFKMHAGGVSGARAFNAAVRKYGIAAFDFKVLALFDSADVAAFHEQAAIKQFSTLAPDGYNLRAGAPYTQYGGPVSAETRAKMSACKKGHIVSAETRARISAASKAALANPATRVKMITAHLGQSYGPQTEAHKAKIGAANTGKKRTADARAKMSAVAKARKKEK